MSHTDIADSTQCVLHITATTEQPHTLEHWLPGGPGFEECVHGALLNNPRGSKPMSEWLCEWEEEWQRVSQGPE